MHWSLFYGSLNMCTFMTHPVYLKHSNDVARQVETPSKSPNFVTRKIWFVVRNDVHITLEDALYHECKTSKCCNGCIFGLTTCQVLRHVAPFLAPFVLRDPQRCNSMIAKQSIQRYFYVGLFTDLHWKFLF